MDREELFDLVFTISEAVELGKPTQRLISELSEKTGISKEELLPHFAYPEEEVADIVEWLLVAEPDPGGKTKEELISIIEKIKAGTRSHGQMEEWNRILNANIPYPDCIIDILEEGWNESPESLLNKMLNYKPKS